VFLANTAGLTEKFITKSKNHSKYSRPRRSLRIGGELKFLAKKILKKRVGKMKRASRSFL
jgi:hypothetical protein